MVKNERHQTLHAFGKQAPGRRPGAVLFSDTELPEVKHCLVDRAINEEEVCQPRLKEKAASGDTHINAQNALPALSL